jgi:hypothetical protein
MNERTALRSVARAREQGLISERTHQALIDGFVIWWIAKLKREDDLRVKYLWKRLYRMVRLSASWGLKRKKLRKYLFIEIKSITLPIELVPQLLCYCEASFKERKREKKRLEKMKGEFVEKASKIKEVRLRFNLLPKTCL